MSFCTQFNQFLIIFCFSAGVSRFNIPLACLVSLPIWLQSLEDPLKHSRFLYYPVLIFQIFVEKDIFQAIRVSSRFVSGLFTSVLNVASLILYAFRAALLRSIISCCEVMSLTECFTGFRYRLGPLFLFCLSLHLTVTSLSPDSSENPRCALLPSSRWQFVYFFLFVCFVFLTYCYCSFLFSRLFTRWLFVLFLAPFGSELIALTNTGPALLDLALFSAKFRPPFNFMSLDATFFLAIFAIFAILALLSWHWLSLLLFFGYLGILHFRSLLDFRHFFWIAVCFSCPAVFFLWFWFGLVSKMASSRLSFFALFSLKSLVSILDSAISLFL